MQRPLSRTISTSVYHDTEGRPLAKEIVGDITQFQVQFCAMCSAPRFAGSQEERHD
jgi:hypothetical protein